MPQQTGKKILWSAIFIYIVFFGIFTALRHYNFQTQTWDMAIFSQSLWNTLHGEIMHNNLEEIHNTLGVHFSPILFLFVPGYALFPTPYLLLLVQTIALGLGAWPLYLLALKILKDKNLASVIAIGYLLYPSLHWVNTYDFHPVSLLIPLIIASFYFLETNQYKWAYLFLMLSATTREDSILAVMFLGIYFFIRSFYNKNLKERRIGMAIALISLIYFLIAIKIIMPALGGGLLRIDRYANLGTEPIQIISNIPKTIFTLEKLKYVLWMFIPAAFLPFLSGLPLILIVPGLLENLLTYYQSQFSSFYQYDSVLIGGIFIASIYGIKKILEKWPKKIAAIKYILIWGISIGYLFNSPVNPIYFPSQIFKTSPQWENLRNILKLIPENPNLSIAAQTNLVPHLSNREHAYMLGKEPFPADIVIVDGADKFGFKDEVDFQNYADNYLNSDQYIYQTFNNRYLIIYKKVINLNQ